MLCEPSTGSWAHPRYKLALGLASCLKYLHHDLQHPLIHRDIKPANILCDREMNGKLADFGEARETSHDATAITMTIARVYPLYLTAVSCAIAVQ